MLYDSDEYPKTRRKTEVCARFSGKFRHLRSLEVLKQDVNQAVFVSMIKSKLTTKVVVQLEMKKDIGSSRTIAWLLDELKHYVIAIESAVIIPYLSHSKHKQKAQLQSRDKFQPKGSDSRKRNPLLNAGYGSAEALVATSDQSKGDKPGSKRFPLISVETAQRNTIVMFEI